MDKTYTPLGEINDEHKDAIIELLSDYTEEPEHLTNMIFEILGLEEQLYGGN